MTLRTAALCVAIVLLALVIVYTLVITSHTEPDEPELLLVAPQFCRQCGKRCKSTYCLDCQIADADTSPLGSGYRPSAWCPRCHAPHRAEANKCPECELERDL